MMNIRYSGSFVSLRGTTWRVDILQDGYSGPVGELTFPGERPLEIEWREKGKDAVLCGSTATLKIESPTDRAYLDLYTVVPCSVALKVYRTEAGASASSLWWVGTLDTEFYEEPYERDRHYDVTLTFEDFGVWGRLPYASDGIVSLETILGDALGRSVLSDLSVVLLSSTQVADADGVAVTSASDLLSTLGVSSSNFYDEDGEAMSVGEVVEGVFQPLGLKIIQRAGSLYVFDLNALYGSGTVKSVVWNGSRQTLGVDVAVNNIKVIWSPYADVDMLGETSCWLHASDPTLINLGNNLRTSGDVSYISWHGDSDVDNWDDDTDVGFTLLLSTAGKGATLGSAPYFFKLMPLLHGSEKEGVALLFTGIGLETTSRTYIRQVTYGNKDVIFRYVSSRTSLVTFGPMAIPPIADTESTCLHISMSMLMDYKFSPFATAANLKYSGPADKDNEKSWKTHMNYVNVPVRIRFTDSTGGVWQWSCSVNGVDTDGYTVSPTRDPDSTLGGWLPANDGVAYLQWYDPQDFMDSSGLGTWTENRPCINNSADDIPALLARATGQYISMPPTAVWGGTLSIEVLSGWSCQWVRGNKTLTPSDMKDATTFILLELPKVEVVRNNWLSRDLPTDDVVYSAVANADAAEGVEIETVCGTSAGKALTARGAYLVRWGDIWIPAQQFKRAGRTSTCEQLLIGTLYSQWATRHLTLSGEMWNDGEGLCVYSERSQPASLRFIKAGEVADLIEETTSATLCELSPDEYDERITS